jgi:hypothetical protein
MASLKGLTKKQRNKGCAYLNRAAGQAEGFTSRILKPGKGVKRQKGHSLRKATITGLAAEIGSTYKQAAALLDAWSAKRARVKRAARKAYKQGGLEALLSIPGVYEKVANNFPKPKAASA